MVGGWVRLLEKEAKTSNYPRTMLNGVHLVGFKHETQEFGGFTANVLDVDAVLLQLQL